MAFAIGAVLSKRPSASSPRSSATWSARPGEQLEEATDSITVRQHAADTFFDVSSSTVPLYLALYGISNFLGPVLLGRLFDTVGRKPMVPFTYIGSAAVLTVMTIPMETARSRSLFSRTSPSR